MPSTYTLNNGIELIATGEQSGTWGDTTNTNFELLDTALDGQVSVTLAATGSSGSPNTLPISDGASSNGRNRLVIFGDGGDLGGTAFVQLTPNDAEKIIYVRNNLSGSRSILLFQGTYNASNDYEVPAGTTAVVFFDGAGSGAVAANVFNNAFFDSLRLGSVSVDKILDEDNMASNDAAALATQQSIKAYVDSQVGTVDTLAEILANGNTTGGTNIVVSVDDVISLDNGTNALPSLTTTGDLNTGIYFPAADEVGITTGGTQRVKVDSTGIDVTGQVDVNSAARIDSSGIVKAANGTAAAPTHAFLNDPDNGMYRNTTNTIGFATAGTDALIIDSSQRVLIGATSNTAIGGHNAATQIVGSGSYHEATLTIQGNENNSNGAYLGFSSSRGTTAGSTTIVQDDDTLGQVYFAGADGTDLGTVAAAMTAQVDGTPGSNDMPGRLLFSTTADGSASLTERMRIDSSGRVGIGTTLTGSPSKLHIAGSSANDFDALTLRNSSGTTGSAAVLNFEASGGTLGDDAALAGQIKGIRLGGGTIGALSFHTTAAGVPQEAMRIDSSQRVLISTTSARTDFSSNDAILQIEGTNLTTSSSAITRNSNDPYGSVFYMNKSRGTSDGAVTIVQDDDTVGEMIWHGADGTQLTRLAQINAAVDGTPGVNDMPGRLTFNTTADGASSVTERMRITSAGNVGIGTSSVDRGKLHVNHYNSISAGVFNDAHLALTFNTSPSDNDGYAGITYATSDSDNYGWSVGARRTNSGVGDFVFTQHTNNATGTERMRLDSNGALLLGTTSRSIYYNSVNVYNASAVIKTNVSNEVADLVITNGNNDFGSSVDFARTNSAGNDVRFATISAQPTNNTAGSEAGVIRFYTKDTGDSNVVERMRIQAGGGISFNGDTAAANALDDYEEGTWTPSLDGSTGSVTTSGGTFYGYYTKVGQLVTAKFEIQNTTISGGSGYIQIPLSDLPYAPNFLNSGREIAGGSCETYKIVWPHDGTIGTRLEPTEGIQFQVSRNGGIWNIVTTANAAGSNMYLSGFVTYRTSS